MSTGSSVKGSAGDAGLRRYATIVCNAAAREISSSKEALGITNSSTDDIETSDAEA